MKRKCLAVGISISTVVLLVLASLGNVIGYQTVPSSSEKVLIRISYSTLRGVEQVEKEISLQDSHHLSVLMNDSDTEALTFELMKLGLVPASMTSEQVSELISGEYGKKEFACENTVFNEYSGNEQLFGTKRNFFSNVQGDARDCIYLAISEIVLLGTGFILGSLCLYLAKKFPSIFPIIPIPFLYDDVGILFFIGLGLMGLANVLYLFRINPFRAIPFLFSMLDDGPHEQKVNLSTRGLFGSWSIQSFDVGMMLVGFVGVWMTIFDIGNEPGCSFRGFSLYVSAREFN